MIKIDGQVNYIGDRCLLLTPSQRQEILEVSICRKNLLTNFPKQKQKPQFLLATLQLMFSFLRRLGVSDVSAKLVVRIKMNRSDCFSLNCSQGLFMMRMIIVIMNDENDEDDQCDDE